MAGLNEFSWPIRVYYEDSDAGGVVYHSNYLNFMERARTEWLRHLGFEQTELKSQYEVLFVLRKLEIQYKKPACFNDSLLVITRLVNVKHSLMEFEQIIKRGEDILTEAVVQVVCVDAKVFKPTVLPTPIRNVMLSMESE